MDTGERLLAALAAYCAAAPLDWAALTEAEWSDLFALAARQNVGPMVWEAVQRCPAAADMPPALRVRVQAECLRTVAVQARQTAAFRQAYAALEAEGVRPLVVKGMVCRSLYRQPDCRPSGDEDMLILPDWLPACDRVLTARGLLRLSAPEDFEVTYQAPGDGLRLELHKALFAPDSEVMGDYNRFFDGAMERAVTVRAEGADLRTLCPHDHLLYLLLHAMKHFIHSGFGIRQVLDIGLFAGRYGAGVDWPRLLRQCREVRGEQFAAAVFDTARRLGLEVPLDADWEALAGDGGPLLRDLLSGGVYGATDRSRLHSGAVTLHAVEAQRRGGGSSLLRTLFPGRAGLEGRYPYLKRYPALLPVAWVQRLWRYGREAGRPGGGASESLKTANRRLALLREYGILD